MRMNENSIVSIVSDIVSVDRASQIVAIAVLALGGGWYAFICQDDKGRAYLLGAKSGLKARGLSKAEEMLGELSSNQQALHFSLRDCSKLDDNLLG